MGCAHSAPCGEPAALPALSQLALETTPPRAAPFSAAAAAALEAGNQLALPADVTTEDVTAAIMRSLRPVSPIAEELASRQQRRDNEALQHAARERQTQVSLLIVVGGRGNPLHPPGLPRPRVPSIDGMLSAASPTTSSVHFPIPQFSTTASRRSSGSTVATTRQGLSASIMSRLNYSTSLGSYTFPVGEDDDDDADDAE
jgi:hypothetical protein